MQINRHQHCGISEYICLFWHNSWKTIQQVIFTNMCKFSQTCVNDLRSLKMLTVVFVNDSLFFQYLLY